LEAEICPRTITFVIKRDQLGDQKEWSIGTAISNLLVRRFYQMITLCYSTCVAEFFKLDMKIM